ncbi:MULTISPECIES: alpha/beta fold hydrolase [Planktothrix]|uniref:Protein PHYLLO, chloroplastic n=2 Tax=Planktothrix TaxID=54304 RepID=A0A9W4D5W0_9CYAN|nr:MULTISPECIES: alpha/beta hydrolase [Planktothrix]MBD2485795.1 alpha/beta hydrolase [Planktothrix sp. FACHB-1365]MBE9141673.1 alpha/beta hydrolase [Planktothrix mougeotii LEGE 06226]CAD5950914.1 Protein PHYLLO, chloroplastic [Planktothrix pseudagardhii]
MYQLFHHFRVQIPQGQIFWREAGYGPTIIFLHGSWADSSQWIPLMQHLSVEYHCVAPDVLGCGESRSFTKIHPSISLEVECLAEQIKSLKLKEFCLVGHGLGGWIATRYALEYPDAVKGLVVIAPEGVEFPNYKKEWGRIRQLAANFSPLVWFLKLIYPLACLFGKGKKIKAELNQRQMMLQWPVANKLLYQRRWAEIHGEMLNQRLHELRLPTLVLQGNEDTAIADQHSKTYSEITPMAQCQIIEGGQPNLPVQMPEVIAQSIRTFITTHVQFSEPPSPEILDEDQPKDESSYQETAW